VPAPLLFGVQKKLLLITTTTSSKKDLPGNTTTNHNQQRSHRPNPEPNHPPNPETPNNTPTKIQPKTLINIDLLQSSKKNIALTIDK
jgi:hypothetical protein